MRIEIPELLVHLRTRVVDEKRGRVPTGEQAAMRGAAWMFGDRRRYETAQRAAALGGRALRGRTTLGRLPWPFSAWSEARDTPAPPPESFRTWWQQRSGKGQ